MVAGICSGENCVRKLVVGVYNYRFLFPPTLTCRMKRLEEAALVLVFAFGWLICCNTALVSNRLFLRG
jgi:hypothetical protein